MKKFMSVVMLGLAMALGLAATIQVSAQEVSRSIVLKRDAKVGDQVLPKGEYAVKYAEGKDELVILRGKHEVLKATYKVTKLDKAATTTAVVYSQDTDGSFQLKRIEFDGKDSALVFENTIAKAINK
jgi:hypothetical protein